MKISRQQVAENRQRLLGIATDQFREHGIDGVGIADVMETAGMCLGSFYSYFDSKEQLVAETCARAITGIKDRLSDYLDQPEADAFDQMVDGYLSREHMANRSKGCVFAALGSEITHQSPAVRHSATAEMENLFEEIGAKLPGHTGREKEDLAIATMASFVGGLVLSRMVDEPEFAQKILDAVKASVKQTTNSR